MYSPFPFRSLPKLPIHEDSGVHQNPQYTGQHHFHPVVHDHDYCERIVINVSMTYLAHPYPFFRICSEVQHEINKISNEEKRRNEPHAHAHVVECRFGKMGKDATFHIPSLKCKRFLDSRLLVISDC